MIPGNCFVCAVVLWVFYGGELIKSYRPGTRIPHWIVLCRDGHLRHFTVVRDLLPDPFYWILFLGRFERIN